MSQEFEKFRREVLQDISLQENLREIIEISEFIHSVVEAGKSKGFDFNAEDVKKAMRESRRAWFEKRL